MMYKSKVSEMTFSAVVRCFLRSRLERGPEAIDAAALEGKQMSRGEGQ